MRLLFITFCILLILMSAIRTSSGAVTQSLGALEYTEKNVRKACASDTECEDNNACTVDKCRRGGCKNEVLDCDDENPCTDDSCDSVLGCQRHNKDCDDKNPCTVDFCDEGGCKHNNINQNPTCSNNGDCADTNLCTLDRCVCGACSYDYVVCHTSDPCTTVQCDPSSGCVTERLSCDDGISCTTDSCDSSKGCIHTPKDSVCDDGNICTTDTCNPQSGCLHTPVAQCSAQCPCSAACTGENHCNCNGGTCACVPNPPSSVPCAPRCETTMTFNLGTCGPTTIPCSGTP